MDFPSEDDVSKTAYVSRSTTSSGDCERWQSILVLFKFRRLSPVIRVIIPL